MTMELQSSHDSSEAVRTLAAGLAGCFPSLSERGQRVSLALYRALAMGRSVPDYGIAAGARLDVFEVRDEMQNWPGVYRSDSGRIVGFWGLALEGTPHTLRVDGVELHGWCAWDTLFLPRLLGASATVRSRCGSTGAPISLEVSPEGVSTSNPDVVVSFGAPEACDTEGDRIVSTLCSHILFFESPAAGARWLHTKEEDASLLPLAEAFEVGRAFNELRYPGLGMTASVR